MDKNAIKKYAIWARRELIERVAQRAAMYGITEKDHGDPEAESVDGRLLSPVEKRQRQALIQKIAEKGYQQVIEEVAYTWFNRFAALRFMEVNGYLPTHIRVFTNDANEFKPQILSEAIHLELEGLNRNRVYELENENKREELFKYLLTVQCNALNEILPGMFQKIEDYTELLLPDNLLRQGSVIEQMISMIPEADWTDQVQIIGWLYQYYNTEPKDKVFADLKKNIKITKENIPAATQLFTPDWIVHYMVENSLGRLWLEGKSEIRNQKSETEREAAEMRLAEEKGWKYYLPEVPQEPEVQAQLDEIRKEYAALKPEEIKVIDPCMGSGHILCVLFDVLVQIYEDYGYSAREAAVSIVENNLWGVDIDDRAAQLAYFAVMMKARQYDRRFFTRKIQPNVFAIEESNGITIDDILTLGKDLPQEDYNKASKQILNLLEELKNAKEYGSIIDITPCDWNLLHKFVTPNENSQIAFYETKKITDILNLLIHIGETLAQKYHVVVTNPPYMGNMSVELANKACREYSDSRYDLFAMFIDRNKKFQNENGFISMVTGDSWLTIDSFDKFRNGLLLQENIVSLLSLGSTAFEAGFGTVMFTLCNNKIDCFRGCFANISNQLSQVITEGLNNHKNINTNQLISKEFINCPKSAILFEASEHILKLLNQKNCNEALIPKAGLVAGDNNRYIRLWSEVDIRSISFTLTEGEDFSQTKWVPLHKGGGNRKYYGLQDYVLRLSLMFKEKDKIKAIRTGDPKYFFIPGFTWSAVSTNFAVRKSKRGFVYNTTGSMCFTKKEEELNYFIGLYNSVVANKILCLLAPNLHFNPGTVVQLPLIYGDMERVNEIVGLCVNNCKEDWDSFETSWDFKTHPIVSWSHGLWDVTAIMCSIHSYLGRDTIVKTPIEASWLLWKIECEERFKQLKANEEELNRIFIDIYGLQDDLTPEVADRDVTVRRADLQRDIRSFISYAVGCMFGRYSLDKEGLIFAGGNFDDMFSKRKEYLAMDYYNPDEPPAKEYICLKPGEGNNIQLTYSPDKDNVLPICDDEYFEDDIVGRFVKFVERVYGKDSLEDNLRFIADALGGKGAARDVIRNYFLNDFYADHLKVYQKRPIYWLFDSGKKNGFKCLIYMHRYQPDTIARIRTDYIHEQQSRYRTAIADLEQRISGASTSERVKLSKQLTKLWDQAEELRVYEEKIHHLADQMIKIDLDDGVKVNYAKFQDVLAPIK